MTKLQQIETHMETLRQSVGGVRGCALISRSGQGDRLYQTGLDNIDPAFLGAVVSSILLIGERLGHELDGRELGYTLVDYGGPAALIMPCGEDTALLLVLEDFAGRESVVEAARAAAGYIAVLLAGARVGA